VDEVKAPAADLKLQIALTEEEIRYTGENGIRFSSDGGHRVWAVRTRMDSL
jgi:hypothetical protein